MWIDSRKPHQDGKSALHDLPNYCLSPTIELMNENDEHPQSLVSLLRLVQSTLGRICQLLIAAALGNHYFFEVRDTTSTSVRWGVALVVIMLTGFATS